MGIVLGPPGQQRTFTDHGHLDTPGYTAVIQAGDAEVGPFTDDSPSEQGGATTTFRLNGKTARYYVIWITDLGDNAAVHVNEVTAR